MNTVSNEITDDQLERAGNFSSCSPDIMIDAFSAERIRQIKEQMKGKISESINRLV